CPLVAPQRAALAAPRIGLGLRDPAPKRRLGQIELTRHRAGTLPALLHHLDRFRLELRRERSPPPLLPHDPLLSHFSCGSECLRNPGKPKLPRSGPEVLARAHLDREAPPARRAMASEDARRGTWPPLAAPAAGM